MSPGEVKERKDKTHLRPFDDSKIFKKIKWKGGNGKKRYNAFMEYLRVPAYRQMPAYCGPASLQMVLAYYGTLLSQEEIGRRAKTTLSRGTDPSRLLATAQSYGLSGRWKKESTIMDLRASCARGVPVIINWFSTNEGHYSVVIGVDDVHVVFIDPETGKRCSVEHEVFMRTWFDFPFPWIKTSSQLRIRWMLVLRPSKKAA